MKEGFHIETSLFHACLHFQDLVLGIDDVEWILSYREVVQTEEC